MFVMHLARQRAKRIDVWNRYRRKTESVLEYHTMQISADGANKNGGKLSFDGLGRYAIENDNDIVTINWASSLFSTFRSSPWLLNENTERNCLCP